MDCKVVDVFMSNENCLYFFIVINDFFFESFEIFLDFLFLLLDDFTSSDIFSDSDQIIYD